MNSFINLLEDRLKFYKNSYAIKNGNQYMTYDELYHRSKLLQNLLSDNKLINNNIGIITQRNFSAYIGILGTIFSGSTYIPINLKYPKKRISHIIDNAKINALICDSNDLNILKQKLKGNKKIKILIFPDDDQVRFSNYQLILKTDLERFSNRKIYKKYKESNSIYIMYTSGSTGDPKGVEINDNNLLALMTNMNKFYKFKPGFKSSQTFDLSFDVSVVDTFFPLLNGGIITILSEKELYCPYDYIIRENINLWNSVPTLAGFMNKLGFLNKNSFNKLKYSIFAGEPLTKKLADRWSAAAPNSTIENLYGPTETTIYATRFKYNKNHIRKKFTNDILPIGKTFSNLKVAIVNGSDRIIENNKIGELIISGNQVSKGYYKNNTLTGKIFKKVHWDGKKNYWYHTGDLVIKNSDGNLEFVGRNDEQIKIAGKRVEIGEIESVLRNHFHDNIAVITAVKDANLLTKHLNCFVTTKLNKNKIEKIKNNLKKELDSVFIPKNFFYLDKLPLTTSGKINKKALQDSKVYQKNNF